MLNALNLIRYCSYSQMVHGLILCREGIPYTKQELIDIHKVLEGGKKSPIKYFYHLNEETRCRQLYHYNPRLKEFFPIGEVVVVQLKTLFDINATLIKKQKLRPMRSRRKPNFRSESALDSVGLQ